MELPPPPLWFIAIGASGGEGLRNVQELLRALPVEIPAAVLVVLHRPWHQKSYLLEVLASATSLPVSVAIHGTRFSVGNVYIGEPAEHLTLAAGNTVEIIADPQRMHRNRTVDLLFKSLAIHAGQNAIGVILAGSLDDGSRGLAAIHEAGGTTMIVTLDPAGTPGMPENAAAFNGAIHMIGTPSEIALALIAVCGDECAGASERQSVDKT